MTRPVEAAKHVGSMNCSAALPVLGQGLCCCRRWDPPSSTRLPRGRCWKDRRPSVFAVTCVDAGLEDHGRKKTAVVVGGGWAGFGAAHALAKDGFDVTLLDASLSPGGLSTGFRTAKGRPVEAGIKGFWYVSDRQGSSRFTRQCGQTEQEY